MNESTSETFLANLTSTPGLDGDETWSTMGPRFRDSTQSDVGVVIFAFVGFFLLTLFHILFYVVSFSSIGLLVDPLTPHLFFDYNVQPKKKGRFPWYFGIIGLAMSFLFTQTLNALLLRFTSYAAEVVFFMIVYIHVGVSFIYTLIMIPVTLLTLWVINKAVVKIYGFDVAYERLSNRVTGKISVGNNLTPSWKLSVLRLVALLLVVVLTFFALNCTFLPYHRMFFTIRRWYGIH